MLRCPFCRSEFSPILEYTVHSYSEHRDLTGYECDNYDCGAEWDRRGNLTIPSSLPISDVTL